MGKSSSRERDLNGKRYRTLARAVMDPAGFEPAAFALRTQRSTPDLQARKIEKWVILFLHPAQFFN